MGKRAGMKKVRGAAQRPVMKAADMKKSPPSAKTVMKKQPKSSHASSSKPFQRFYGKTELRPFDVMVTWQVASCNSQSDAFRIATAIAQRKFNPAGTKKKNDKDTGKLGSTLSLSHP